MVDIGQNNPVDLTGRQLRIVDVSEHRDDAGHPVAVGEFLHDVEHLLLDVDAENAALRRDTPGQYAPARKPISASPA